MKWNQPHTNLRKVDGKSNSSLSYYFCGFGSRLWYLGYFNSLKHQSIKKTALLQS